MTHPTHSFETPLAREAWGIGVSYLLEAHPCGHLHNFTGRPVTLPTASAKEIQNELSRLKAIGEHRGTCKEL